MTSAEFRKVVMCIEASSKPILWIIGFEVLIDNKKGKDRIFAKLPIEDQTGRHK